MPRVGRATRLSETGPHERQLVFDPNFLEDLAWWVTTQQATARRVLELVEHVRRDPFRGIGKPEPLKGMGASYWSRRITQEHRLVYRVSDEQIYFVQCRYHY